MPRQRKTESFWNKKNLIIILLLLSVSMVSAFIYHLSIKSIDVYENQQNVLEQQHESYISHTVTYPSRYRVLIPTYIEFFHQKTGAPLNILYDLNHLLFLFLSLVLIYLFLKKYLDDKAALLGVLLFASLYPIGYNQFNACDILVLFTFALTAYIIAYHLDSLKWNILLIIVLFISTFNKEETLFAALLFMIFKFKKRVNWSSLLLSASAVIACAIPYLYLRHLYGKAPYFMAVYHNFSSMSVWLKVIILAGTIVVVSLMNLQKKPEDLKWYLYFFLFFFAMHLIVAVVDEPRVIVPVLFLIFPLFLLNLFDEPIKKSKKLVQKKR